MDITKAELLQCKRAVVVLSEVRKIVDQASGAKQAPLELREDMAVLMKVLRRLEKVAS